MSPEFYAIIGVGVSLAGFMLGLFIVFFGQMNRRMDRLETRMDQLEDKFDRLQEQMISLERQLFALEKRVSRLEWMLDMALDGKPARFPPETDADNGSASQAT